MACLFVFSEATNRESPWRKDNGVLEVVGHLHALSLDTFQSPFRIRPLPKLEPLPGHDNLPGPFAARTAGAFFKKTFTATKPCDEGKGHAKRPPSSLRFQC